MQENIHTTGKTTFKRNVKQVIFIAIKFKEYV